MTTIYRPAIRSGMGVWNYYVSTLSYNQIARYVKMPDEIYQSKQLSDMLQRALSDNAKSICEYLHTEKERFFNSLVLAIYDGDPKWHEGVFEMKNEEFTNIGVLELTGEEKIFPVDGQHRVSAIKALVEQADVDDSEEVPIIFIAHKNDEKGVKRTRRLFTTLNRYAKPVSKSELIALDEDDVAAIVTRMLVEDGGIFQGERIAFNKTEAINNSDKCSFTTIITLGACNSYILKAFKIENRITSRNFTRYRPDDETINKFAKYVEVFWTELINRTRLNSYMQSNPNTTKYRHSDGGDLLFRPAGLKAYVEALVDIHIKDNVSFKTIMERFETIDTELSSDPWRGVLWNNGKMIMNNKSLIKSFLFFYYTSTKKSKLKVDKTKMISEYRALIGSKETDSDIEKRILQKKK